MIIQGTNYKVRVSLCKDKLNCMSVSVYGRPHVELGLVMCIIVGNSVYFVLGHSEYLGNVIFRSPSISFYTTILVYVSDNSVENSLRGLSG